MTRRRSLSDEERALWTGIVRSIKPLQRARKESAGPAKAIEVDVGAAAKLCRHRVQ